MAKADLSTFSVKKDSATAPAPASPAATAGSSRPNAARTSSPAEEGGRVYVKKTTRITKEADRALAVLSAEIDKTEKDLIAEALNLLFRQYKKPPLA